MSEQVQALASPAIAGRPSARPAARRGPRGAAALEPRPLAPAWVLVGRVAAILGAIAAWELATRLHLLDSFFWSTPSAIWATWLKTVQAGTALQDTLFTFRSTLLGFALGTGLGAAIGLAFWWSRYLARIVEPLLIAFHAMPKLALAPVVVLVFGLDLPSKVAMAVAMTIVVTALTAYAGVKSVDPDLEKLLFTLGASRWQVFTKVIVPWTLPWVISALRLNIGLALSGAVVGEFIGSRQGLGRMIAYAGQTYDIALVWVGVFTLSALALVLYLAVGQVERYLLKGMLHEAS
jgi:NitT/TauT family transport system permease protein